MIAGATCIVAEVSHVIGELIAGKYKVEAELGQGGMGTVYRARIVRNARPVAIKVLRKDVVGVEQYESRFEAEALMTARIKHPNVVELLEHGYLRDGRPYLVLELLTGRSLGDILQAGEPFKWPRALAIIRQAALGLGAAHAHEIVHRDLKPENIFLLPKQGGETVKIMDFGLAKSLGIDEEDMDLTRPGFAIGTPAYMAPERVTGNYDCRSDLYGLMVVAYHLMTGEPPFAGQGTEVLREHLSTAPRPMSETNRQLQFPASLEWLLAKALAKNVEDRHKDAAELIRDIDSVLEDANATLPSATPAPIRQTATLHVPRRNAPRAQLPTLSNQHLWMLTGAAALLFLIVVGWASARGGEEEEVPTNSAAVLKAADAEAAESQEQQNNSATIDETFAMLDAAALAQIEGALATAGYVSQPLDTGDATGAPTVAMVGARQCSFGKASGLLVTACVFADDEQALAGKSSAAASSTAETSVIAGRGRALLQILDPDGVDPEGRNVQQLIESFTRSE